MTWLALLLAGVGVADLVASARPTPRWVSPAAGSALVVLVAALAGLLSVADWLAVALACGTVAAWHLLAPDAEASPGRARGALAALLGPMAVLLGVSGFASAAGGPLAAWLAWVDVLPLDGVPAGRAMLLGALTLANLATAHLVVRYVLVAVDARPPRRRPSPEEPAPASERLRGGRLLGPMERLLVLGFGVAGNLTAAGVVVAAKGLLRWPELQAAARDAPGDVDEVTEYFLIGTFTSLLLALASVALVG